MGTAFNTDNSADDYTGTITNFTATSTLGSTTAHLAWTYQGTASFEIEEEDNSQPGTNYYLIQSTGGRNLDVSGLNPDDNYSFRIRADHPDGTVSDYQSSNFTFNLLPAPTLSVTLLSQTSQVSTPLVAWSDLPANASSVYLQIRGGAFAGPAWRTYDYTSNNDTAIPADFTGQDGDWDGGRYLTGDMQGYLIGPGAPYGTEFTNYQYRLMAVDSSGKITAWSQPQSVNILNPETGQIMTAPTPTFTSTDTSITATWRDPSAQAAAIYMIAAGQAPSDVGDSYSYPVDNPVWTGQPDSSGNFTATIQNLTPGTKYYFAVEDGEPGFAQPFYAPVITAYSSGSATTTGMNPAVPTAPQSVSGTYITGTGGAPGYVQLHWTNSSNNEKAFQIWRSDNGGPFKLVGAQYADQTTWNDTTMSDLGPWKYEVLADNPAGTSPLSQPSAAISPIGGPDITGHLQAIAGHFETEWEKMTYLQQVAFSTNFSTEMNLPGTLANNFDIVGLANHNVRTSANDGILPDGQGDQSITVTVDGNVYRQVEVDYFLYGLIFADIHTFTALSGEASATINTLIHRYNEWYNHNFSGFNFNGREAWFLAGYENDFDYALPAAISGVSPAPRPNGTTTLDIAPLYWFAGNSKQMSGTN